jgi:tetratricopeptide (TPR) repeat protein
LGVVDRLALAGQGFFFYLWKVICPSGLLPIYELRLPLKLVSLDCAGAVVGTLIVVGAAVGLARRAPALAVATMSYLLLLLPAVGLIQGAFEAAGDRYSYVASIPLMLGVGAGLFRLSQPPWPYARTAFLAAIIVGLPAACSWAVLTWRQCEVWRTPVTLWTYADKLAPRSGLVAYHLGRHFDRAGEPERAVQFYRAAVSAQPAMLAAQLSLANALMAVANPREAVAVYRRALGLRPRDAGVRFELGAALAAAGEFAEADEQLREAIALNPAEVRPRRSLGHLLMLLNRPAEAADAFRAALALTPHDADLYYNLGRACLRAGQSAEAGAAFRRALQEDPTHRLAQQALGELRASPSDPSGARP